MGAIRFSLLAVSAPALLLFGGSAGADNCRLCTNEPVPAGDPQKAEAPLSIDIVTKLSFSRTAKTGNGSGEIRVNPATGAARINGGLVDLGGYALAGTAIVSGEPGRIVRIDMPASIQMTASSGGVIELSNILTDLNAAPRLDTNGRLQFSFGGNLRVDGNISGKFRGRIPITVQYE
jgi:hypothetical protein